MLLVWNLVDGIDVYQLIGEPAPHLVRIRHLRIKIRRNRVCFVQFDHDGKTAIAGGDNGQVLTWSLSSGKLVQVLPHGKGILDVHAYPQLSDVG
jgi:WD40 repeat protein